MAGKKTEKEGPMRLDKFLVQMGKGSRSQIRDMAKKGRIQVNGQTEKASDRKVNPESDAVTVDGVPVSYVKMEYFMLNKPQGVVSATEDGRYPTVVSLLKDALRKDLFPVGRLDIDTEGLLLITNDGAMAHSLLSPKKHVDKVYFAHIQGSLPADAAKKMEAGVVLSDGTKTLPAALKILEEKPENGVDWDTAVTLTIHEGKFHQVKRMFEALGCKVVYLKRLSMGPLRLDEELLTGQYRPLTEKELAALQSCTKTAGENEDE